MADKGGDYFPETEDFDISRIILIQAALRGALVRKWMKEVKQTFEEAFVEIESNSVIGLEWKSDQLCQPRVVRMKDREKKQKETQLADVQNKVKTSDLKGQNAKISMSKNIRVGQKEFNETDTLIEKVANEVQVSAEQDESISEIYDTLKYSPAANELHLDLDIEVESLQSQRSQKSSQQSSQNSERQEDSQIIFAKSDDDIRSAESVFKAKIARFEEGENRSNRSSRLGKSERSMSSSSRKYDEGEEAFHIDQRSSRSEGSQKRKSKRSSENIEKGDLSDRRSIQSDKRSERDCLSNRSNNSTEKSQMFETERFSPRGHKSSSSQNSDSRSHRSKGSEKGSEGQLTHKSGRSDSFRQNSHRSDGSLSHRSDKSEDRKSQRSQRSRQDEGQRSERMEQVEKMHPGHPQESRASPVEFQPSRRDCFDEEYSRQGRPPLQDSTSLTNVTSVWDSFNSVRDSHDIEMPKPLPQDATQLKELRKNIAMELLWVQQAIDSRKNYLKLKGKM